MKYLFSTLLCLLMSYIGGASIASAQESADSRLRLKDLFYGEALYHIYQDDYFAAVRLLDHELGQHYGLDDVTEDTLFQYKDAAELSIGELELSYRMHQKAGRSLKRLFNDNVDQETQNKAALRMARILFNKGQYIKAINALKLIRGKQDSVIMTRLSRYLQLYVTQKSTSIFLNII